MAQCILCTREVSDNDGVEPKVHKYVNAFFINLNFLRISNKKILIKVKVGNNKK